MGARSEPNGAQNRGAQKKGKNYSNNGGIPLETPHQPPPLWQERSKLILCYDHIGILILKIKGIQ